MNGGKVTLLHGNALSMPLADRTVSLVVSSPPYFAVRDYQDAGASLDGQLGSEASPYEFLVNLWRVMDELWRVLRDDGSCWINLGDKFAGSGGGNDQSGLLGKATAQSQATDRYSAPRRYNQNTGGVRPKSRMLLPHLFAEGCEYPWLRRAVETEVGVDPNHVIPQWIVRMDAVWCLSGGAKVYARTPTGDRPVMVRDLARSYQPENIKLWNGEKWTQVLGWNRSADTAGALELELRSGERIGCTIGHQWPTNRGLLRADEIRVGDLIDTCRLPEPEPPRSPHLLPDTDIGWLVGLYIAEGSRSSTMIQFAGHANETLRHARLARIAEELDGQCNVYQTGENSATCNLSGPVIAGVIDRYVSAGTAPTKRLTLAAWQRSDSFLASVVEGYLSGDGHYDAKNERWRLGFTRNDDWAGDLRTLAARLGATLTLKRGKAWGFDKPWDIWRGEWRWPSERPPRRPRNEVVAIRFSRARQFFDIGVEDEPHTFALASGVLTHNSKPNGLPESVTDRVRASHEYLFHLTKSERYYAAIDEVREAQDSVGKGRPWSVDVAGSVPTWGVQEGSQGLKGRRTTDQMNALNPLGKVPGSVWTIATEPLIVPDHLPQHFAAFPSELPRRIILGWSPPGICTACREGRRPVVNVSKRLHRPSGAEFLGKGFDGPNGEKRRIGNVRSDVTITGYACACPTPDAPTTPSLVLDPFSGTGTTPIVAAALGRHGVGVELSADYLRLARWRAEDPTLRCKVLGVDKPAPELDGQQALFGGGA